MRPLKILIVEDEGAIRRALQRMLSRMGHEILLAANGEEAAELLRSERPDAILMDLRMPGMSGETLYHLIASQYPKLKSRIIVMTGDPEAEDHYEWLEINQLPILMKPFEFSQLEALLRSVVGGQEEQEQPDNHQGLTPS
jgi:two-component system response regulator (stage 0 sporulation protein F)